MDANRSSQLCNTHKQFFDLTLPYQHQVSEFINHYDDSRKFILGFLIVACDVSLAGLGQKFISIFHLFYHKLERFRCLV